MTTNRKRADRMADNQAVIDATNQFFAKNAKLTVGSNQMLPAAIVAVFQARINSAKAVIAADAAAKGAVAADRNELAQSGKFVRTFRRFVQASFAETPETLAAFHLTAPRVAKVSVATKAQAKVKSEATRAARGTVGKKAKLKITGETPATGTPTGTGAAATTEAPAASPAPQAPAAKPTA